jgi:hypothetical protein
MALAADHDLARHGDGVGDVALDLLDRALVDQRALHDADLDAVADLHLGDLAGEFRDELVMDAVLHEEAVGADAGLAHVAVLRGDRALDGGVDVGVVEDDEGRVAAQFQPDLLHRRGRLLHQQLADRRRAGEADEAHGGVRGHDAADLLGVAGHDVDHALGEAGALGQLDQREAVSGVSGAGLTTKVQPAASPGRICA